MCIIFIRVVCFLLCCGGCGVVGFDVIDLYDEVDDLVVV